MKKLSNIKTILFIILSCLFIYNAPVIATNIPDKYSVTYFSAKNGVEDGLVNHIIQDHKGLLWFATWNGLYRFDGYVFKNYKSSIEDKKGLTNDRLLHIDEDKYGYIWVLCYDSTGYRFNPGKELFEPIEEGIRNKYRSIRVLPNGTSWLLRTDGTAVRATTNPHTCKLTLKSYSASRGTLPGGKIQTVFMDSEQYEWILTDKGLYKLHGSVLTTMIRRKTATGKTLGFYSATGHNGEVLFGAGSGQVFKYTMKERKITSMQLPTTARIISILKHRQQTAYITDRDGLFITNTEHSLPRHFSLNGVKKLKSTVIESAHITRNGLIWLTHPQPGVTLFDTQAGQLRFTSISDELGNPLNTETGFFTIEDKNGFLWIHPKGGGFSYYDSQSKKLVPFNTTDKQVKWKSNDRCFAALADKQGNLWMSTQLDRLKRITFFPNKFHIYTPNNSDIELPDNEIRALFIDNKKRIWTGARDNSISIYDPQLKFIQRFKSGKVYAIMQDQKKNFWISTKGQGLSNAIETAPGKFQFKQYTSNINNRYSLSSNYIYYTFQDSKKRIWVATYGGGLNLMECMPDGSLHFINYRNRLKKYPIEHFYKVRHITEDQKGRIWVSTTAGILYFDGSFRKPEEITFHTICREQSNVNSLSNNDVQMVKCMNNGNIFAITYGGGLNELIPTGSNSFTCKSFTQKNGLSSDIIYSMQEDKRGNLWLATGGGLVKFIATREQIQYPNEHIAFNVHFSEGMGATDGKQIYFGTNKGLLYFTPERIHKISFIPRIFFNSVWVNNQEQNSKQHNDIITINHGNISHLTLPPNNHSLRIGFSALDMTNTEYTQYAYMLQGFDKTYRLTDNGREANYTNLPPGKYIFRIKSTNNEGVWVNNERILSIEVQPAFNETTFAHVLYIFLSLAFIIGGVYIYTVFYKMKQQVKNEEYIAEQKLSFFTNVSHELRTPLTLITGPLELILTNEELPDKVKDSLNTMKKNSDRMQRLVGQILDISKLQENRMKLRIQHTDIVKFTEEMIHCFEALATERHINLTFTSEPAVCHIWVDTDHMEKIIFNLLSNAFKYTPNGKNINIYLLESNDSVTIRITDQGIGIPKEKQKSIFNRFENLVQNNIHSTLSTGIGLALVKELVAMHHGEISVESEPGKGSSFSIRLLKGMTHYPAETEYILSDLQEETETVHTSATEEEPFGYDDTEMQLMLIVEDNHELRAFIRQVFEGKFRILEAQNGSEGLSKAFSYLPDIIITDIMMPVMDGMQMLTKLRNDERTSHIPAVVLTAKADMNSILTGVQTGADDYIVKPFSVNYLQVKIKSILNERKKMQTFYSHNVSCIPAGNEQDNTPKEVITLLSEKDKEFLDKLSAIMEEQMNNPDLNIDYLVSCFNLSRTNFFHKLKSLTGLSPILYIKEARMQKAARLVKEKEYSIAEVAYMVGFSDPHYFSKCFKSFWGVNATDFARQQGNINSFSYISVPLKMGRY
ncbi:two-component regulator propeller domain-containing protein [uncultured Bacteroides sp.]|uniref:two-component regulator propeller domain-containing protein n=1 Tax=uncultured Bacteroides sp. TaxID=162156 RepID=UPI002AA76591|nr:two-component regulator propeller domain-containing protein [uncultured Bacteroides sp.]